MYIVLLYGSIQNRWVHLHISFIIWVINFKKSHCIARKTTSHSNIFLVVQVYRRAYEFIENKIIGVNYQLLSNFYWLSEWWCSWGHSIENIGVFYSLAVLFTNCGSLLTYQHTRQWLKNMTHREKLCCCEIVEFSNGFDFSMPLPSVIFPIFKLNLKMNS